MSNYCRENSDPERYTDVRCGGAASIAGSEQKKSLQSGKYAGYSDFFFMGEAWNQNQP